MSTLSMSVQTCTQAIWPTEAPGHKVTAIEVTGQGVLWTGSEDGSVIKWSISSYGKQVNPELFMSGHNAPIKALAHCTDAASPHGVLVSVDGEGGFCVWDCLSGYCLQCRNHVELAGAIGTVAHYLEGHHVSIALDHSRACAEGEMGSPRRLHALVLVNYTSLDLLGVWHPDASVPIVDMQSMSLDSSPPVLLGISVLPEGDPSSIIGVTSAGMLLFWQLKGEKKQGPELSQILLPDQSSANLQLPLESASFGPGARTILLTGKTGWCLFTAQGWNDSLQSPANFTLTVLENVPGQPENSWEHIAGGLVLSKDGVSETVGVEGSVALGNPEVVVWDRQGNTTVKSISKDAAIGNVTTLPGVALSTKKDALGFLGYIAVKGSPLVLQLLSDHVGFYKDVQSDATEEKFDACVNVFNLSGGSQAELQSSLSKSRLSAVWNLEPGKPALTEQASEPEQCNQVTCMALVGGVGDVPYTLIQGFSNGDVTFTSLAVYAIPIPLPQENSAKKEWTSPLSNRMKGHRGGVSCFLEVSYESSLSMQPGEVNFLADAVAVGASGSAVVVSGGVDGSVRFWSLEKGSWGKPLFAVHPHTGTVRRLLAPPAGSSSPWCECVVSVGDDGVISIISLESHRAERTLSGFTFGVPDKIVWDGQRGFIACLGKNSAQQSVVMMWDIYSAQRDRVFMGVHAEQMLDLFSASVKESAGENNTVQVQAPFREALSGRVARVDKDTKPIKLMAGPRPDIALLDIGVGELLESRFPPGSLAGLQSSSTIPLSSALCLIHVWGLQDSVDAQMGELLKELKLLQSESVPQSCPSEAAKPKETNVKGMSLTQGAVIAGCGGLTLQIPYHLPPVVSTTGAVLANGTGNSGRDSPAVGPLWRNSPGFVSGQLLCLVAMAKKLMHEGLNEVVCSACSSLVKQYAIQFLQLLPEAARPSLSVLVEMWEDGNDVVKETSRVLFASTTNPEELFGSRVEAGEKVVGMSEIQTVLQLWKETGHHIGPQDLIKHEGEILVSGAICCVHSRLVTDELLQATSPLLACLVTLTNAAPHTCVTSATMLAEALSGLEGEKWMKTLGDTPAFIQKVFDACDALSGGSTESQEIPVDSSDTSLTESVSTPGRQPKSFGEARGGHIRSVSMPHRMEEAESVPPPSKRGGTLRTPRALEKLRAGRSRLVSLTQKRIKTPFGKTRQPTPDAPPPSQESGPSVTMRKAGSEASLQDLESAERDAERVREQSDTVRYKEALVAVLIATASLDLPLFLHALGSRLSNQPGLKPYSIMSAVGALSGLLHNRDGPGKIVNHLPLMVSVLAKALDPTRQSLKRHTQQGVCSFLNELSATFPMVDIEHVYHSVAIGYPVVPIPDSEMKDAALSSPETVSIMDLHTGSKRRSLSLGRVLQQVAGHLRGELTPEQMLDVGLGIGALSFRRDGEVLVAYCPGVGVLCVWDLRTSWQQKLMKSTGVLEPVKVIQIHGPERSVSSSQPDLGFRISWQLSNQVAVMKGETQIASVELHISA